RRLAQMHEDLVLYTPGGECGELDVLVRLETAHRLYQPYRADGDQILKVDARVVEPLRDVDHKAQIALYEPEPRLLAAVHVFGERPSLLFRRHGRRKRFPGA